MSDKTWQEEAIEACELRDIEIRDDDDLMDVFIDYCNPISHIEKLQKQIEHLKAELAKERSVVNFYADIDNWDCWHEDYDTIKDDLDDQSLGMDSDCPELGECYVPMGGKLARQRQRERNGNDS